MLELHVGATMVAGDVLPFHRPRAEWTLVAIAREQVETHRRQRDHYQSDQGLLHGFTICSGQAFLQSLIERADIQMMTLRHQVEKRVQLGVGEAGEILFDFADHPALPSI
jgi:hypothetical protein